MEGWLLLNSMRIVFLMCLIVAIIRRRCLLEHSRLNAAQTIQLGVVGCDRPLKTSKTVVPNILNLTLFLSLTCEAHEKS